MESISVRDEETGLNIHFIEGIKVYEIRSSKDYNKLPPYNNPEDHADYMCQDMILTDTIKLFPDLWNSFSVNWKNTKVKTRLNLYSETLEQAYKNAR